MEEDICSDGKAIQEGIFLFMVDYQPPKGHFTHTNHLTLTFCSRSQQPF